MRIISGKYKSRRILMPKEIRPTRDNVREAIFNVIAIYVKAAKVLDLFAGSGAFGIEALSRGASYVVFVDELISSTNIIKKNLKDIGEENNCEVITKDAQAAIKTFYRMGERFDIIFLDPPYYRNLIRKCLKNLNLYDILTNSGLVVAEHSGKDSLPVRQTGHAYRQAGLPPQAEALTLVRQLKYSNTIISIYKKRLSQ